MNVNSRFVDVFLDEMRPTLWPIYLILVVLIWWVGTITVRTLFLPVDVAGANAFATRVQLLMFAVGAVPFARPALVAAVRCRREGEQS